MILLEQNLTLKGSSRNPFPKGEFKGRLNTTKVEGWQNFHIKRWDKQTEVMFTAKRNKYSNIVAGPSKHVK